MQRRGPHFATLESGRLPPRPRIAITTTDPDSRYPDPEAHLLGQEP